MFRKGPGEGLSQDQGRTEPDFLAGKTEPLAERTRRAGAGRRQPPRAPLGKHNLQSNNRYLTRKDRRLRVRPDDFRAGNHGRNDHKQNPGVQETPHRSPPPEQATRSIWPVLMPAYWRPSIRGGTSVTDS